MCGFKYRLLPRLHIGHQGEALWLLLLRCDSCWPEVFRRWVWREERWLACVPYSSPISEWPWKDKSQWWLFQCIATLIKIRKKQKALEIWWNSPMFTGCNTFSIEPALFLIEWNNGTNIPPWHHNFASNMQYWNMHIPDRIVQHFGMFAYWHSALRAASDAPYNLNEINEI